MFKEFKKFALKGNMVDLAVGIIIGTAFGTMVKSMVDDVLMPPLGMALGGVGSCAPPLRGRCAGHLAPLSPAPSPDYP